LPGRRRRGPAALIKARPGPSRPPARSRVDAAGRWPGGDRVGPRQRHRPANPSSGISKTLAQKSMIDIFSHEEQYDWLSPAQAWAIAACCV
jgi:hypothetical protein